MRKASRSTASPNGANPVSLLHFSFYPHFPTAFSCWDGFSQGFVSLLPGMALPQRQVWLYGLIPCSSCPAPRRAPRRHQTTQRHPTGPGKTSTNTNPCLSAPSQPSHYPHPSPHQKNSKNNPSPQTGFGNHRTPAAILIAQQQPRTPRCPRLPGTFASLLCKKKKPPKPQPLSLSPYPATVREHPSSLQLSLGGGSTAWETLRDRLPRARCPPRASRGRDDEARQDRMASRSSLIAPSGLRALVKQIFRWVEAGQGDTNPQNIPPTPLK